MDQFPPKNGSSVDLDDVKYVSRLSTILVATIEEAKDRISQIEYIFCSQLYPNVQSKYKNSQEVYLEAKRQAEDGWRDKENQLLLRIEELERGKQEAIAENQSLKLDKEKWLEAVKREMKSGVESGKERERIGFLEEQLAKKCAEAEEGMEVTNRLIRMVQSKSTTMLEQSVQLKQQEEKTNGLLQKVEGLEKKVEDLTKEIGEKNEEMARQKELFAELEARTVYLNSGIVSEEKKVTEEEMVKLKEKIHELERNLEDKTREMEQGRVLQQELQEQVGKQAKTIKVKILKEELEREESDRVVNVLERKIYGLEGKIFELQRNLKDKTGEVEKGRLLQEELQAKIQEQATRMKFELMREEQVCNHFDNVKKELEDKIRVLKEKVAELQKNNRFEELLKQIQAKDAELMGEKGKNKDLVDAYKKLKHQYTYLCEKCGLTSGNMLPQAKLIDIGGGFKHPKSPTISPELKTKDLNASTFPHEPMKVKIEDGINDGVETDMPSKTASNPSFHLPLPRSAAQKLPPTAKPPSITGVKRPASGWIETRSGAQGKHGPDPHDDFLSTPLENLRANKNKVITKQEEEEVANNANVVPAKTAVLPRGDNDSDDETQNMNVDPGPAKRDQTLPAGKNGFKYVETVRKKAEREKLKGVECKQCKKFYDAVLAENEGGGNNNNSNENLRCEHHDGVSRHRYRYAPPMTPEGFWNIGFESEM